MKIEGLSSPSQQYISSIMLTKHGAMKAYPAVGVKVSGLGKNTAVNDAKSCVIRNIGATPEEPAVLVRYRVKTAEMRAITMFWILLFNAPKLFTMNQERNAVKMKYKSFPIPPGGGLQSLLAMKPCRPP